MPPFKPVPHNFSFPDQELKILAFWKEIAAFKQSIQKRQTPQQDNTYTFYDGPPFATGLPHYGHFVASTLKDVVPRYWTMRGKCIERRFGWDTHGLPIEMETEKTLGISGPTEIRALGVDKFNEACRNSVLKYTAEWEETITRLGRWVDFENNYKTMDASFMESVWWVFGQLWNKKLVYQDFRVMPYSWRLSTPLSNFEANLDYRSVQDPAITIKLKLSAGESLLVWTTTPWTLPSNVAVAVHKDLDYVRARQDNQVYILAKSRLEAVLGKNAEILSEFKGTDLIGQSYAPAFDDFKGVSDKLFYVLHSDHVSTDDGTGLVHMAPAFGQEDFDACKKAGIPFLGHDSVDEEGRLLKLGLNIKEADPILVRELKEKGLLFKQDTIQHNYPYCWRSGTPLIYKAIPSWFVRVTELKDRLVKNNQKIHWVPEVVGEKRFGNWLEDAQDWCISRNRFWGTPIPLWKCDGCEAIICIDSIEKLQNGKINDIHPHKIDGFHFTCSTCSGNMKRIPEVFDCWFESGSMPYAQNHYPFENQERFKQQFPADFIAEGLDQTRAWFYTLLVLSTALFDKPPFKNVIVNGLVLAEDGSKMSKSKKNYPDPNLILNQYGADALRAYLINSPVVKAEPLLFNEKGVKEVVRSVLLPLYNTWSFFVQYANIDGWEKIPSELPITKAEKTAEIDQWIVSKLHSLTQEINTQMEGYYLYKVIPRMLGFIDDLTNWYIRRSRRRFWRNATEPGAQADKQAAYSTLYEVLVTFSKLIAPVLPFMAETLYQNLSPGNTSVHWCDYPIADKHKMNPKLEQEVEITRQVVSLGRALREKHKLKTRQPLIEVIVVTHDLASREAILKHAELIQQELNVKKVTLLEDDASLCHVALKANFKTLGKRFGPAMKEASDLIAKLGRSEFDLLQAGKNLEVAGEKINLEDILVTRTSRADIVLETAGNLTVALETNLTKELIQEGLMRETLSQLQKMRKDLDFKVTDRVKLTLHTDSIELKEALSLYKDYLTEELLVKELFWGDSGTQILAIDKHMLQVSLE